MISSIVFFTDTSGFLDAITGVSGALLNFGFGWTRLQIGGGGGRTGVSGALLNFGFGGTR